MESTFKFILEWILSSILIVIVFLFIRKRLLAWLDTVDDAGNITSDTHSRFISRILAFYIDSKLFELSYLFFIQFFAPEQSTEKASRAVAFLLFVIYKIGTEYWFGKTAGKHLFGLRMLHVKGLSISLSQVIYRNLLYILAFGLAVLGYLQVFQTTAFDLEDSSDIGLYVAIGLILVLLIDVLFY